jgi:hypothetical protein
VESRVSQTDSFIEEVNEEVRRDRLYRLAKRYGWIVVLAILLVVGGAAANEWRKAQARSQAQALGDAMYQALERDTPLSRGSALADIGGDDVPGALARLLASAELAEVDADRAGALLEEIVAIPDIPPLYRDLAVLKLTMIPDFPLRSDQKLERLQPLTAPGAPFRMTALEQVALVHAERRETEEALAVLSQIEESAEASPGQRQRVAQLRIALGDTPDDF